MGPVIAEREGDKYLKRINVVLTKLHVGDNNMLTKLRENLGILEDGIESALGHCSEEVDGGCVEGVEALLVGDLSNDAPRVLDEGLKVGLELVLVLLHVEIENDKDASLHLVEEASLLVVILGKSSELTTWNLR